MVCSAVLLCVIFVVCCVTVYSAVLCVMLFLLCPVLRSVVWCSCVVLWCVIWCGVLVLCLQAAGVSPVSCVIRQTGLSPRPGPQSDAGRLGLCPGLSNVHTDRTNWSRSRGVAITTRHASRKASIFSAPSTPTPPNQNSSFLIFCHCKGLVCG